MEEFHEAEHVKYVFEWGNSLKMSIFVILVIQVHLFLW